MNRNIRNQILLVCFIFLFVLTGPVHAQDRITTPSDDEVNAVAGGLYCPVCENVPLDVCGTQACIQWRELISEQLAQGRTSEEIQQYFVERYGEQVLVEPPLRGFKSLLFWLPSGMFVIGMALLVRTLRMRRIKLLIQDVKPADEIAPYVERLEDELKTFQTK